MPSGVVLIARLLFCAAVFFSSSALAHFARHGTKLVAIGGAGGPEDQGRSVSISADGKTAIVGAPGARGSDGAAWVWTNSSGVWAQQAMLVGSDSVGQTDQGVSVAVSGDGKTVIVGGNRDNGGAGAVWVWTRTGDRWVQQGPKLVGLGAVGQASQGVDVAISGDGDTVIVGAPGDNRGTGAAWVWTRTEGIWIQQGNKLVGSGAVGNALQGLSVALSADGNTAIIGAPNDNGDTGAWWVWTRTGGVWTPQGSKFVSSDPGHQTRSMALSGDGNTAIIGSVSGNGSGHAWVWARTGQVWTRLQRLEGSGAIGNSSQGWSVALSADGNTAIVGGPRDNHDAGAFWVWTRTEEVWSQLGAPFVGSGALGNAFQGYAVAVSADGKTVISGAPFDNDSAGAAWIFHAVPSRRRAVRR